MIARESGDEHSDRNTTNLEADRIKGGGKTTTERVEQNASKNVSETRK